MTPGGHDGFGRFLDIMLPHGGYVLVMIEAYFDESGTHSGAPILSVGGYLFERENCKIFDTAWRQMLTDFQVPFFHMASVECGDPPFDKLPRELRYAMVRRAIGIIKETMTYAVVVAANKGEVQSIIPKHRMIGGPYSFLAFQMFPAVSLWADNAQSHDPISYVFESGAEHQEEANAIMQIAALSPDTVRRWRYDGHAFKPKRTTPAVQAADLLVWHYCDDVARERRGETSRDTYVSLIDDKYWHLRYDTNSLRENAASITATAKLYPEADAPMPGATDT